jgi:hypothetical protein
MDAFRAIYYPNSDCSPLTLAKAILIFDELTFYDHASINTGNIGTIGHDSHMRHGPVQVLQKEGYSIRVLKPADGPIEDELQKLIDEDLGNDRFRKVFFELIHNDASFLISKVPNGNYGEYGNAEEYRKKILTLTDDQIPRSTKEIKAADVSSGITPELTIVLAMIMDSFNLNFSAYTAIDEGIHLFGNSKGMDLLLKAKFESSKDQMLADKGISQNVAFALMEHLVPNGAFYGKSIEDIARFRNETAKLRDKFKERILELTVEFQELGGLAKEKKAKEILYKQLLPEARTFQERSLKNWDNFFKESVQAVAYDSDDIIREVLAVLPLSVTAALVATAARVGKAVVPNLVNYLQEKSEIERTNPYAYLMKLR